MDADTDVMPQMSNRGQYTVLVLEMLRRELLREFGSSTVGLHIDAAFQATINRMTEPYLGR